MIERSKTCCFTGHRHLPQELLPLLKAHLKEKIESLSARGVTSFLCGGALGFDTLAAEAVLALRQENPRLQLVLALPCPEQAAKWTARDRAKYQEIINQADEVIYTSDHYTSGCMHKRNRFMVDHSCACILFLTNMKSGTAMTVKYAIEQDLELINLLY